MVSYIGKFNTSLWGATKDFYARTSIQRGTTLQKQVDQLSSSKNMFGSAQPAMAFKETQKPTKDFGCDQSNPPKQLSLYSKLKHVLRCFP